MDTKRRSRVPATLAGLLVLASIVACGLPSIGVQAQGASARPGELSFGTLTSLPEHAAEEADAGVSAAMVEIAWDKYEPAEGRFDEGYLQSMVRQIEAFRAAGRTVTLDPTLHYAPGWVKDMPDGRLIDEEGNRSEAANLIFNQRLRESAETYLAKVAAAVDLGKVTSIRVSSGAVTEVLYPGGDHYWAFDAQAQNGPDRPPTMAPNPAPGWRPGEDGLDTADVRDWADWYVGALNDAVNWQLATYSRLGFRGNYEVLTPGTGVLPEDYDTAVEQGLPPGLLGAGAAWQVFYAKLPRRPDVVAYVSSVADQSGDNDVCQPDDRAVQLDSPDIRGWSSTRWVTRLAREYGFAVGGENPGWRQSRELDRSYQDLSDTGMMAAAIRQARGCGLRVFYWAHDERLWDGTVPFAAYADRIAKGS